MTINRENPLKTGIQESLRALGLEAAILGLEIADYQFENMPEKRIESDRVANEAIMAMMDGEWF